ncbi:MAG: restriction endonuclease, partial [Alphaproteobacteria bacterium]
MTDAPPFGLLRRNPDVLTCIANLSNDEVFTPPEFAARMMNTLAEGWAAANGGANLWADSSVTFLDPCTKSGVFLREIAKRLIDGLANEIPDLQARVDHVLTKQLFGIGITRLTALLARRSLYCSKWANGDHSVARHFNDEDGNVWFERTEHSWVEGRCRHCAASKGAMDRGDELETHAYAFIHADDIKARIAEWFGDDMQFDVIIGNPPYQMSGTGGGTNDAPIYQHFVEQAMRLEPRLLSMV